MARGWDSRATGTATRVKHGSTARCAPWIKPSPIVIGEGRCLAIDGPESWVVVRGILAAAAAVLRRLIKVREKYEMYERETKSPSC